MELPTTPAPENVATQLCPSSIVEKLTVGIMPGPVAPRPLLVKDRKDRLTAPGSMLTAWSKAKSRLVTRDRWDPARAAVFPFTVKPVTVGATREPGSIVR